MESSRAPHVRGPSKRLSPQWPSMPGGGTCCLGRLVLPEPFVKVVDSVSHSPCTLRPKTSKDHRNQGQDGKETTKVKNPLKPIGQPGGWYALSSKSPTTSPADFAVPVKAEEVPILLGVVTFTWDWSIVGGTRKAVARPFRPRAPSSYR
jgi:hypothetical protein